MSMDIKKKRACMAGILALAAFATLAIALLYGARNGQEKLSAKDGACGADVVIEGTIPALTTEEIRKALQQKQDASMFTVQADTAGTISKGSKTLTLNVANPASNSSECFFDLLIEEAVVYTSSNMKPGTYVGTETLSREIGESVPLTIRYHVLANGLEVGRIDVESQVFVTNDERKEKLL